MLPAILGDFVVASCRKPSLPCQTSFSMCDVIAFIPEEPLFTEKVAVLPEKLAYKEKQSRRLNCQCYDCRNFKRGLPLARQNDGTR